MEIGREGGVWAGLAADRRRYVSFCDRAECKANVLQLNGKEKIAKETNMTFLVNITRCARM